MVKVKVILVTGRTINQGVEKEKGKFGEEYSENVAICLLDPEDIKVLGIEENTPIKIYTEFGATIVKAVKSKRSAHPGIVFMPYGPWANQIINSETNSVGMPSLKGISAEIEPAPNEKILTLAELVKQTYRKLYR